MILMMLTTLTLIVMMNDMYLCNTVIFVKEASGTVLLMVQTHPLQGSMQEMFSPGRSAKKCPNSKPKQTEGSKGHPTIRSLGLGY